MKFLSVIVSDKAFKNLTEYCDARQEFTGKEFKPMCEDTAINNILEKIGV